MPADQSCSVEPSGSSTDTLPNPLSDEQHSGSDVVDKHSDALKEKEIQATATDASVASIMHNMSWGADSAPLCSLGQQDSGELRAAALERPASAKRERGEQENASFTGNGEEQSEGRKLQEVSSEAQTNVNLVMDPALLQELHARATAQAAREVGLSASAAMAMLPMLPEVDPSTQAAFAMAGLPALPATDENQINENEASEGALVTSEQGEQSFTCSVCRKVFKREMNLIFHMTTHRPRQPQLETSEPATSQPVKCQDCNKEFATKYQAKKHYLRRHFQGEKPFACIKCNKKRFVVKEDLTMHMKSCGNVYMCNCGIRLCSLGALKRHCKYFNHEPESLEPRPEPQAPSQVDWNGLETMSSVATSEAMAGGMHAASGPLAGNGMGAQGEQALSRALCSHAAMMRQIMSTGSRPPPNSGGMSFAQSFQMPPGLSQDENGPRGWNPEMLQGMAPSLAHALRQAANPEQQAAFHQVHQGFPDIKSLIPATADQRGGHNFMAQNGLSQYGGAPFNCYRSMDPGHDGQFSNHSAALSAAVSAAYMASANRSLPQEQAKSVDN